MRGLNKVTLIGNLGNDPPIQINFTKTLIKNLIPKNLPFYQKLLV